jgi:hypothetical protein
LPLVTPPVDTRRWWQGLSFQPGDPAAVAAAFADAVRLGLTDLPLPGSGRTRERWAALAWWGGTDLSLARLVAGHTDAVAILAELGGPALPAGATSAVWAAEPPGGGVLSRSRIAGRWELSGIKSWCSGASLCDTALLTAVADEGSRLFLADLAVPGVARPRPTWTGLGMPASDTESVRFDEAPAISVGGIGSYLDRPGFWIGGIGVAAVWHGGAAAAARPLRDAAADGRLGAHGAAHLGRVRVLLDSCSALLESAALRVDARPSADHEMLALTVRSAVADAASEIVDRVGRALGPAPLANNREHAQRVADLTVYLRQHHAERDLERLGDLDGALAAAVRR